MTFADKLELLPVLIPALVLSLVLHELAHAWVGHVLGDPTPKEEGRLTLNPNPHIDPVGAAVFVFTFMFTGFAFGWAKPVMINPRKLRGHPQRGMALVAIAGPLVNFAIAFTLLALIIHAGLGGIGELAAGSEPDYWDKLIIKTLEVNIVLGIFNLIPIPPLDGSRIVGAFMPKAMYEEWAKLDQFAPVFILVLIFVLGEELTGMLRTSFEFVFETMARALGAG